MADLYSVVALCPPVFAASPARHGLWRAFRWLNGWDTGGGAGVLGQVFQSSGFGVLMMLLGILLTFGFLRGGPVFGDYFIEWVGNRVVMDCGFDVYAHAEFIRPLLFPP